MMRRLVVVLVVVAATGIGVRALRSGSPPAATALPAATVVTVYKSPSCGCCAKWVDHLRAAGYTVVVHDTDDLDAVMTDFNVPRQLASCHTAKVGPYVVEGHVPADLIAKALKEHPAIAGLAVPGMVTGSPGMEGGAPQSYDIVAWTVDGHTSVYAHR
ncbi:MAG TPA: DUF411 domain-containing protein [Gemmatimonadales bacterium]|nr:DUF411 domain-containing protein [Gemmatimonadales bacterium]